MKVALIASPYPLSEAPSPPLGLTYAAAACEAAGAEVVIFDYIVTQYTPEKLHRQLDSFRPDVVGTNSVTMNFYGAAGILREAKRYRPEAITVMGGPHATFDIDATLRAYPEIDLVVMGEGEATIEELLPVIHNRDVWAQVKGIAFRDGNRIVQTPIRPLIEDLDSLPLPSRHLLPLSRYEALGFPVSIITGRGCPNRCIFCLGRKMVGYRVRQRSSDRVVDEIEQILSYGCQRINVADDTFTANRARVKEICSEILRRGLKFSWSAFSRVNTADTETLSIMREAGCDSVSFGIESGNAEMLKQVRKGITLDQARQAVRCCKEAGLLAHASFIAGLPGETHDTLRETSEFAEELDIEYGYHMLAPFPGTTISEHLEDYDLQVLTDNWDLYDANRAIVRTSAVSADELDAFVKAFEKTRYDRWYAIVDRVNDDKGTDQENLMVEGHHRMNLIFKMLSEDVVERVGSFDIDGLDPAMELARAIGGETQCDSGVAERVVSSLEAAGSLKPERQDGHVRWSWTHNNRAAVFENLHR